MKKAIESLKFIVNEDDDKKKKELSESRKKLKDYNWREVANFLNARLLGIKGSTVELITKGPKARHLFLYDNGGEMAIKELKEAVPGRGDLPFHSNFHPGGAVGEQTLAYRILAYLDGRKIDYKENFDTE